MFSISLSFLQSLNVFKAQHNRVNYTVKILLKTYLKVSEFVFSVVSHLLWGEAVSLQQQGMAKKPHP